MDKPRLTQRQEEVLDFIRTHPNATVREIGGYFGFTANASAGHIKVLIRKGYLERGHGARSLRIVGAPDPSEIMAQLSDPENLDGRTIQIGDHEFLLTHSEACTCLS